MSETTQRPNPPVRTFQAGLLNVAIFAHAGKDNRTWFSVSPQRSYKKEGEDTWQRINSYNRDDIPVIAELMNAAFRWIILEESKAREASKVNQAY